jgi:hypothetical protein
MKLKPNEYRVDCLMSNPVQYRAWHPESGKVSSNCKTHAAAVAELQELVTGEPCNAYAEAAGRLLLHEDPKVRDDATYILGEIAAAVQAMVERPDSAFWIDEGNHYLHCNAFGPVKTEDACQSLSQKDGALTALMAAYLEKKNSL